jgi:hypothetical protein
MIMADDVYSYIRGWVAEKLSSTSKIPDGALSSKSGIRLTGYNEQICVTPMARRHVLAADGTYFVTTNPTIGTGVAHALNTSHDATKGLFAIYNSNPTGGKSIHLDYLRLIFVGTATATSTSNDFVMATDTGAMTPTANSALRTPVNVNSGDSTASGALVYAFAAGTLTIPAASATRRITGRVHMNTGVTVNGDEYVVQFGHDVLPPASGGATAARATDTARKVAHAPPMVIAPGHWGLIYRYGLAEATNTPTYEYELAHYER